MKQAKRFKLPARKPAPVLIIDETHLIFRSDAARSYVQRSLARDRRPNSSVIATQAMMRFNSGKRIRFLGSVKRADGSPLKQPPTQFIPAQVVRRLAD